MKDKFSYITTSYNNIGGHDYGYKRRRVVPFWTGVSDKGFRNAYGDDEFPIMNGSSGAKVEQLKQALRVLGQNIDEEDFSSQTKKALEALKYPTVVMDENKFNEIILRAYHYGGKKSVTLTEPEMRALWMEEVSPERRDKVTFEVWLKRQNVKSKITKGGKQAFDVLFGWLQMRARGAGNTGGVPNNQPENTSGGWFSKTTDGSVPTGYIVAGSVLVLGLGIWGASVIVKRNRQQKIAYVQN
jgi:hypothetical protein